MTDFVENIGATDSVTATVTRHVESWSDLSHVIEQCSGNGWMYRGVTNVQFNLIPKIGRPESRKDPKTGDHKRFSSAEEARIFNEFKRIAKPHFTQVPIEPLEVLAIGQHHGLPTRLLDWSESPLVAAFFAAENAGTTGVPAIYAIKDLPELDGTEDPFNLPFVAKYRPPHINPRIPAQRAVFTVHPSPSELELRPPRVECWQLHNKTRSTFWLKQILDTCGINRGSLFPDLDGLATHLGWRYKWGL